MVEPLEAHFPGLRNSTFRVSSPSTRDYNCIAWAAGDTTRWWWPELDNDATFWPADVGRQETLTTFAAALATLGYTPCAGEEREPGFEKVALYAKDGFPTHATRQWASGQWTSKLGNREDIEHELHALSGDVYGMVVMILKRPA